MRGVIGYFPGYAGYTILYVAVAGCIHGIVVALPERFRLIARA
jgi:hypothetical protein